MKIIVVVFLLINFAFNAKAGLILDEITLDGLTAKAQQRIAKKAPSADSSCSFVINEIGDDRQNKETAAILGRNSLGITNLPTYFDEIKELVNNFTIVESAAIKVEVRPKLIRMYTYFESLNILGVTAFTTDFVVNGEVLESRQYRGFYAKTNWANGQGEHLTTINDSIENWIEVYVSDLNRVCKEISKQTL
ncbi:hypothetical protein [Glaciecola petra]|uniref:Uncharacterized protein n=1 Tax=Glaciecola petra TaxID=3075602 RepID=A0ABU2ZTZ2_9ALTE|nr:hypothetical protein [Aestuariibacter sp. P117]MDT0596113.1 hypothetical protein [Aestuariibacter sp. P117]